jgi:hypothetical protein
MGLEHVGIGIGQSGAPDLKKPPLSPGVREEPSAQAPLEDAANIASHSTTKIKSQDEPPQILQGQEFAEQQAQDPGIYIGVVNGTSVSMRVNNKGDAEYSCGGSVWSKSPPSSFTKSKIRMSLDTLRNMGIDVRSYERSLGSFDNNSAPVNLVAEDDIAHSYNVLQFHHEEKNQPRARKTRPSESLGPLFISNPEIDYRGV